MNQILKYVVVCKKGYIFTSSKEEIKKFVGEHGKDIAYYIGYFNPLEDTNFIDGLNINIPDLGVVINND